MNYEFQYNSPQAVGKMQPFGYSNPSTNEYLFSYGRDIYSDLEKFNAPIFAYRKNRSVILNYENMWADKSIPDSIKQEQMNIYYKERNVRIPERSISAHFDRGTMVVNSSLLIEKIINNFNTLDYIFSERNVSSIYRFKDIISANRYLEVIKQKEIFMRLRTKFTYKYKEVLLKNHYIREGFYYKNIFVNTVKTMQIYKDIYTAKKSVNDIHIEKTYMAYRPIYEVDVYKNYFIRHDVEHHKIFTISKDFKVKDKLKNGIQIVDLYTANNISRNKPIQLYNSLFIVPANKDTNILKQFVTYHDISVDTAVYKNLQARPKIKDTQLMKCKFFRKYKKKLSKKKMDAALVADTIKIWNDQSIFTKTNGLNINVFNSLVAEKDKLNYTEFVTEITAKQNRTGFNIYDTNSIMWKNRLGFIFPDTSIHFYKDKHNYISEKDNIFFVNNSSGLIIDNTAKEIYKEGHGIYNVPDYDKSFNIIDLPLMKVHDNTIWLLISPNNALKSEGSNCIRNTSYSGYIDDLKTLTKDIKETRYQYLQTFVYDESKKAFLEYFHPTISEKKAKESLRNTLEQFVEKDSKNGIIYDIITTAKKKHKDICISYDNAFVNRDIPLVSKNKDFLTDKKYHDTANIIKDIIVTKEYHIASKEELNAWVTNTKYGYLFDKDISVKRDTYEIFAAEDGFAIEKAKEGFNPNAENLFTTKSRHGIMFHDDITLDRESKSFIPENNTVSPMQRGKYEIPYEEDYILISREKYEQSPLVQEYKRMEKTIKDLEKPVEKTYNWAYVYEDEDPINPSYDYYGLDELLLPEKDVDYSSFEDIIFNKNTLRPRSPIKIIDDKTFIAKYPIKHPTPNYDDIGIEYVDVPTELMYELFLKFYKIWYANVFKFGNMSMVDSLKLMLDYMYSHIVINYTGTEYLEPALRVFRQIRWFGETSVMQNAQYKISFEYDNLKSNLQKGYCAIPNAMTGMFVDTTLKVISSDSTYFNNDAYINLYIQNREDTQISFSISFMSGYAEVYINDELIDTINHNNPNAIYELPGTTETNTFTIKRPASINYSFCYIGNIIVKNALYKDLTITYDPDLKAGNMPLNDIVNRMIILANMYDNQAEVFEQFRKGNLAVGELYKRLQEYWELHHADKTKGKRLTIKET